MHALIVLANPERASFCHALAERAAETIRSGGHSVEISDLYAEQFNPVAGRNDFTTVADPKRFHYQTEQEHAVVKNGFVPEIRREQERLARADVLILQFPLWWGGPPAILKGWAERVLAYGFGYVDGRRFDTGLFKGRRAMISVTTGGTLERFSPDGVYGPIDKVLYPVQHLLLEYMGYTVEPTFAAYAAPRVSNADRAAYLDELQNRIEAILCLPFEKQNTIDGSALIAGVGSGAWSVKT